MIRCIIIEDERLAQDVIIRHLQQVARFDLLGVFRNPLEAKPLLDKAIVDLMFLDIQLPGITGLAFLRSLEHPPLVVFTTAYAEHALESYEFNVIDYLLKPISFERFSRTVGKIADAGLFSARPAGEPGAGRDDVFIRSNNKFHRIGFSSIVYIEGMKDYVKIHAGGQVIVTHQTMSEMETMLPAGRFIRIHKSYIVSLDQVSSIFGNSVETSLGMLPIGLIYKDRIMSLVQRGRP